MGYRSMTVETLVAIRRRALEGESRRDIAKGLGLDKKTVNAYAAKIAALGDLEALSFEGILEALKSLIAENQKPKPKSELLEPLATEIGALIKGDRSAGKDGMKPKTAWEVIRDRHGLEGVVSYETFKRYVRDRCLLGTMPRRAIRIETEPGAEVQVDYGKVGMRAHGAKRRAVHAFCGLLSCSRLPFIQFGFSQDEVAFAQAVSDMFQAYGGSPRRINLDNLKAGVITPSTYDPTLNRTFAELCEHYGVIADPARVASPKDKGKVERFVQVARELYKKLDALYPEASLDELNRLAWAWCRDDYGRRVHGTTGLAPAELFEEEERPALRPLPPEPFVAARWCRAKVQPDQFIQHGRIYYGLPGRYIGKKVELRITPSTVTIYFEHRPVRKYAVAAGKRRYYLPDDFPAYAEPFAPGSYAAFLAAQGARYGAQAEAYLKAILADGGNLSARRARGCLNVIQEYASSPGLSHVLGEALVRRVYRPEALKARFEDERHQVIIQFPVSELGSRMAREAGYYAGP